MHKKAKMLAIQAITYKKSSIHKFQALKAFLEFFQCEEEHLLSSNPLQSQLKDPYLSEIKSIINALNSNLPVQLETFQSVLNCALRYEGIIVNWHRAYKLNKIRASLYKIVQNYKQDKLDNFHPLFYYKIFKSYLNLIIKAKSCYLNFEIDTLWKSIGKDYFGLSIEDCFFIIKAKSFSRCNLKKSVTVLRKQCENNESHLLLKYFFVKFEVELIKLTKKISNKRREKLLKDLDFVLNSSLAPIFIFKTLYRQAELYYELGIFDKALESLKNSKGFKFSKKVLKINEQLIEQQMLSKKPKLKF